MVFAGIALLVVSVVLLLVRRAQQGKLFQIAATETSTARELTDLAEHVGHELGETGSFVQVAEVKGLVKCDGPLTSEIAKQPCVYYASSVSREYEETYWETDSETKQQVQRTRRGSENVAGNSQRVPFWVEDGTGRVLVDPEGAEIESVKVVDRFERGDVHQGGGSVSIGDFRIALGGASFGLGAGTRTIGYRLRENILPLDRRVYVLGKATDSPGQLTIQASHENGGRFIISLKTEEELLRSTASAVRWLLIGTFASAVAGAALILADLLYYAATIACGGQP